MIITVYHGSHREFSKPSLTKSKNYRDFGNGFYVTENFYDALSILSCKPGFVYEYELDMSTGSTKEFEEVDIEELIDYILLNRTQIIEDKYDFVKGATACNCSRYFKKARYKEVDVDRKFLLKSIKESPYDNQICIKTNFGLNQLTLKNVHKFDEYDFE